MKVSIKKIQIRNLRGIREISIDLGGENLLILGENGTGKSSIVDAVELFFTKDIEKFAGRADIQKLDVIPFIGSDFERNIELTLSIDSSAQDSIKLNYSRSPVYTAFPATYTDFFSLATQRPFILHRYQLMRFIEERPAKRYESLSTLIGMEKLDEIVKSWRKVLSQFEKEKENAELNAQALLREVQSWMNKDVLTDSEVCEAVNSKIIPLGLVSIKERAEIVNRQEALKGKFSRPINFARAEALRTAKSRLGDFEANLQMLFSTYVTLYQVWQTYLEKSSIVTDAPFDQILADGYKLIVEKSLDYCPLCEQTIGNRDELIGRLDKRLQNLHDLMHIRQSVDKEKNNLQKSVVRVQESLNQVRDSFAAASIQDLTSFSDLIKLLHTLEIKAENEIVILDSPETIRESATLLLFFNERRNVQTWLDTQLAELNPTETEQTILDINNFLARLDEKWIDWQERRRIALDARQKYEQNQLLCARLIEARRAGIQKILDDLQSEFIRIYNLIHPGEGHKAISILMDENKANSAELYAEVHGIQAMHPMGHYSEGHLDSMGLCIFLALIKKFNSDLKLIVLDDVLTSIDSGHRLRVARLIANEFKDYQIILTTHDEFWANELGVVFKNDHIPLKLIRMNPWNQQDGATYNEYAATDWDYYQEQIKVGRKTEAIAGAGRALERFLFTMRRNLHLEIPATMDDRYTIGDLYGKYFSWLDSKLIVRPDFPDFKQQQTLLKEDLDDYWRFRNWAGAHYNEWGEKVSQQEAKRFVEIVRDIVSNMQCPACSALVIYDFNSKVVRCPSCKPTASTKVVWTYKSNWRRTTQSIIETTYENPKKEKEKPKTIFMMTRSALNACLQDARRKFGLALPATADDKYQPGAIFESLTIHLLTNPRDGVPDWVESLSTCVERLPGCMADSKDWVFQETVNGSSVEFFSVVSMLTGLLECQICGDLVHFDRVEKKYFCAKCDKKEFAEAPGAHWFTE